MFEYINTYRVLSRVDSRVLIFEIEFKNFRIYLNLQINFEFAKIISNITSKMKSFWLFLFITCYNFYAWDLDSSFRVSLFRKMLSPNPSSALIFMFITIEFNVPFYFLTHFFVWYGYADDRQLSRTDLKLII